MTRPTEIAKQAERSYRAGAKDGLEQAIGTAVDEHARIFGFKKTARYLRWLSERHLPAFARNNPRLKP